MSSPWRDQAQCATARPGSHDPRDESENIADFRTRVHKARTICSRCVVAPQCLSFAAATSESGVRAGFLLANGKQTFDHRLPCGTTAAYRRHTRNGTKPCRACKDAWTAARRLERVA